MTDEIDDRLRQYASRWRLEQPPPAAVQTLADRAVAGPSAVGAGSRRRWAPLLVLAAAVALIAGAIGLLPALPQRGLSTPTPTPTPTLGEGVVAFRQLPATGAVVAEMTTPASPDPSLAQALSPCKASSLQVSDDHRAQTGTAFLNLTIASTSSCRLGGRPDVTALDPDGNPLDVPVDKTPTSVDYTHPVAVGGGAVATLQLTWSAGWCADPVVVAGVRLDLPEDGGTLTVAGFGSSQCYGVAGSGTKAPIRVRTFTPKDRVDGEVVTIFHDVRITLTAPRTVEAGRELLFTVELLAPPGENVPLDPCPDYRITFGGELGAAPVVYALNCAGVAYRDSAGRPYLPGGVPVVFAMRVSAPRTSASAAKLTWELVINEVKTTGSVVEIT